jgi:acyl-CoA thioester hydrolase
MATDPDLVPPAGAFTHRFEVPSTDVDELGHASNVAWVRWVGEAATAHSAAVGLDLEAYVELGLLWVVRRHEVEYLGEALGGEALEAITWVVDAHGATSRRRTVFRRVYDGATLGHATTTWVVVRTADGRPTRIPKGLLERYGFTPPPGKKR